MGTGDSGSIHRLTSGRERAPHLPGAQDLVSGGGAGGGASAEPPSGSGGHGRWGAPRPGEADFDEVLVPLLADPRQAGKLCRTVIASQRCHLSQAALRRRRVNGVISAAGAY